MRLKPHADITAPQMIAACDADLTIAGGVESMTRAPWVLEKPAKSWAKPGTSFDTSIGWRFPNPRFDADTMLSMPETAERVAQQWGLKRAELDAFALRPHKRALNAIKSGGFAKEIVVVQTRSRDVGTDEGPRADATLEQLASLRPVNGPDGLVTAGNASSLNDGAAALVVPSERYVEQYSLQPHARLVAAAGVGVVPETMGIGPVPAPQEALRPAGWTTGDLDSVELTRAFASQAIACAHDLRLDEEIVNADGGTIALGRPLGASGARILLTLSGRMERGGGRRGLATMCVGVRQGTALLIERP